MTNGQTEYGSIRIKAFDRTTEFIAMELEIQPISLVELRRLAGFPDDLDTAVGGIDLKPEHLPRIRQWIDELLDSGRFDVQFSEGALSLNYKD